MLKQLNREFLAIAKELQSLRSLAVYHAGMSPPGSEPLPNDAAFRLDPPLAPMAYRPPERVRGVLLGTFGQPEQPSHVVVVNLDYKAEAILGLSGPGLDLDLRCRRRRLVSASGPRVQLRLPPGGGTLVRRASR